MGDDEAARTSLDLALAITIYPDAPESTRVTAWAEAFAEVVP